MFFFYNMYYIASCIYVCFDNMYHFSNLIHVQLHEGKHYTKIVGGSPLNQNLISLSNSDLMGMNIAAKSMCVHSNSVALSISSHEQTQ